MTGNKRVQASNVLREKGDLTFAYAWGLQFALHRAELLERMRTNLSLHHVASHRSSTRSPSYFSFALSGHSDGQFACFDLRGMSKTNGDESGQRQRCLSHTRVSPIYRKRFYNYYTRSISIQFTHSSFCLTPAHHTNCARYFKKYTTSGVAFK